MSELTAKGPIGVFDSGYGGLTVFREIRDHLPDYDYIYLGDNARTPYGTRSLDTVYEFTLQGVQHLFDQGCHLVILACNTASANALRRIQQEVLPARYPEKRVLGVIRPTTEMLHDLTQTGHLGICATEATVNSQAYVKEALEYAPAVTIHQQACPMWVPIVENEEQDSPASGYYSRKYIEELLAQHSDIDAVLLACTHYPILANKILEHLPTEVRLISQGSLVATSLKNYLLRHSWLAERCAREAKLRFLTTDSAHQFDTKASKYFGDSVQSEQVSIA